MIPEEEVVAKTPEETRPINLGNSDAKLTTWGAVDWLAKCSPMLISSQQRCAAGKLLTDNIIEAEGTMMEYTLQPPGDQAILATDFGSAFPSLDHGWLFECLRLMELDEDVLFFLMNLYDKSSAQIFFNGVLGPILLILCGVRQGCPASMLAFNVSTDPVLRWVASRYLLAHGPALGVCR